MSQKALINLRNRLAEIYLDVPSIRRLIDDSQINSSYIHLDSTPINNWHSVLKEAERSNRIDNLLNVVDNENRENINLRRAVDAYRRTNKSSQPKKNHHSPKKNNNASSVDPLRLPIIFMVIVVVIMLLIVMSGNVSPQRLLSAIDTFGNPSATPTVPERGIVPIETMTPEANGEPSPPIETITVTANIPLIPSLTSTLTSTPQPTATKTPVAEEPNDLRILSEGLMLDTYLIEGSAISSHTVGDDLVVYTEPIRGSEVAIALLKVIGQSPNSLTAQAILSHPQIEIRTRMRVDNNLDFLSESQLVPVFDDAAGYLLRRNRVRLRPGNELQVGMQLQALEYERINVTIVDALRTDSIMQITDIGVDGQIAAVALVTGTWPVTGTNVSLVPMPTPAPTFTATPSPTASSTFIPSHTPTPRVEFTPRPIVATNTPVPTLEQTSSPSDPCFGATASITGPPDGTTVDTRLEFSWQINCVLPEGYAFEPVFWLAGETPMQNGKGFGGTTTAQKKNFNPDQFPPAGHDYFWGVLLVKTDPYLPIRYLGGGRGIRAGFTASNDSGNSSGGQRPD